MERVEVPVPPGLSATGETLNEATGPLAADELTVPVRITFPEKPKLVSVMVDVAEQPAMKCAGLVVVALREKP